MEGPTPVSALIHAATMVAAGVYLVTRNFCNAHCRCYARNCNSWCFYSLIAATIALTQNDIKKVLAYSTVSQLGYMIMSLVLALMYLHFSILLHMLFLKHVCF